MRWQALAALLFGSCVGLGCGGADGEPLSSATSGLNTSPYPKSPVITSITWDFAHMEKLAYGSDLWPTTWGADDNVWGGWGDGGGFGGDNTVDRVSLGFAKIAGSPPGITGTNVWGNTKPCGGKALFQATFCGKPESMISVGGVLYAWIGSSYNPNANDNPACPSNPAVSNHHLAWSTNGGASWQEESWAFDDSAGALVFNSFLNFGRDNAGARDGYVYLYGYKNTAGAGGYLARVPQNAIGTLAAYQVLTGLGSGGQPTWSSSFTPNLAAPIIAGGAAGGAGTVFYHAVTKRYVNATFYGGVGSLAVYDAPEPWGPWTTVEYETNWGGFGNTGESLALTFPTKWVSTDGKTVWGVFSWGDPVNGDAFHLMKATLGFGSAPLVTIDSVSTGKAYTTATAAAGQTLYIDRTFTIASLGASLAGGTLVETANDDKHVTVSNELVFTLARPATVAVVYDNRLPVSPGWLSGWTLTTDTFSSTAYPGGVRVYARAFGAGTVTLGGNLASPATLPPNVSGSNYVVVVK